LGKGEAMFNLCVNMTAIRVVAALTVILFTVSPSAVGAADLSGNTGTSGSVLISEIMTASNVSASEEFIELYNPSAIDIGVSGWTVEYKSATSADTSSSWSKKGNLSGIIKAHGYYLLAPKSYLNQADADWSPGMAGTAGVVRLRDTAGTIIDLLGYGSISNTSETAPALAPAAGQGLERLAGRLDELGGNGTDTNNNALDFLIRTVAQPQSSNSSAEPVAGGGNNAELIPDEDLSANTIISPIQITELLPNPAAPLTDAADEFIELYNPNSVEVEIGGYKLQSGSNFSDSYILPGMSISANGYVVLYSNQTKLALTNSGGASRILNSVGALVDQTAPYSTAADGNAWALFDDNWHWTLQSTPGRANVLEPPLLPLAAASANSSKAGTKPKTTTKPKSSTAKPKASAIKTKSKTASKPKAGSPIKLAASRLQPATWLIIGLVILTIGYALYEYRNDIFKSYQRLRGNRGNGSGASEPTEGRRGD
jgi:hypothetical protein